MSWYRLYFGGSQIGDEVILTEGYWQGQNILRKSENLEQIVSIDNSPISIAIFPRFRVRKKADNFLEFEQWVFDVLNWADGGKRRLDLLDKNYNIVVSFGDCKLIKLERTLPKDPHSARWSDNVVLTFQGDIKPIFY